MYRLLPFVFIAATLGMGSLSVVSAQTTDDALTDTLNLYWHTSPPFIYENEKGHLTGIEYDLFIAFQNFMLENKGIDLYLNWKKANGFSEIFEIVDNDTPQNAIGVSAISITDGRKQRFDFAFPYMPDMTILISSEDKPALGSFVDLSTLISTMDAVTVRDTKYEALLYSMQQQLDISFDIIYIDSDKSIMDWIGSGSNRFGFIDLPVFLLKEGNDPSIFRQHFFTIKGQGHAYLLPKSSKWKVHLDVFFSSENHANQIRSIIKKYLGEDIYSFIDNIYEEDEIGISILAKEKEMQVEMLRNINLRLEQEQFIRRILIVGISVVTVFLIAIAYMFYRNQRTTHLVFGHKDQIDEQQVAIRDKNEQLMNRNAQLVALNEEKNNLVKILAHDIRSPLSQIIMAATIVNDKLEGNLEGIEQQMLNQIGKSADRINQMVSKILDVEGLEGSGMKVLNERVDVNEIMRDIAQRYRPLATKKGIELSLRTCNDHNIVRTDHLLLLLVLENLVSNAVKFSSKGQQVELSARCAYDSVLFKVSDEGPGFSDEDKEKVFSRFQKLSAKPTAGESSTGLGLSIVKSYVNDLGGKVWLESQPGTGTTFFVKLTA